VTDPERWMTTLSGRTMTVDMAMIVRHTDVMTAEYDTEVNCDSLATPFSVTQITLPRLISNVNFIDDLFRHQTSMDSRSGHHHHEPTVTVGLYLALWVMCAVFFEMSSLEKFPVAVGSLQIIRNDIV